MSSRVWFERAQVITFWAVGRTVFYLLAIFFRFRVYNRNRIPKSGPLLVVANHQSFLDPFLCGVPMTRTLKFMARRSLYRNPVFNVALRLVNTFPVTREGRDTQALRTAIRVLKEGRALLIYPEGTRSRDGKIGPMRGGMDVLARRSGATVLPVAIDGGWRALPRDGGGLKLGPLMTAYGRPIRPEEVARMSREQLSSRVRGELVELLSMLRAKEDSASGEAPSV